MANTREINKHIEPSTMPIHLISTCEELDPRERMFVQSGVGNIYFSRARKNGLDLRTKLVDRNDEVEETVRVNRKHGELIPMDLVPGFEPDYQGGYITFLPQRAGVNDWTYDESIFLSHFEELCQNLIGAGLSQVTFVTTTPGTFDEADDETMRARRAAMDEIAEEYGLHVHYRTEWADRRTRPQVDETVAQVEQMISKSTLLMLGGRFAERNTPTTRAINKAFVESILEQGDYDRVVTTQDVGLPLAMAEAAIRHNLPVEIVRTGSTERWQQYNVERLADLEQNPGVQLHGDNKMEYGRGPAVMARLLATARVKGATQIVFDNPEHPLMVNIGTAANLWPKYAELTGQSTEGQRVRPSGGTSVRQLRENLQQQGEKRTAPVVDQAELPF